jgi:hypothetical protein
MSKYNKTPSQPKTEKVLIRVTESEKDYLRKLAFDQNKTITRILLESIYKPT